MTALADAVREALRTVFDPCSVTMGAPVSIVDMGLVTGIDADGEGRVRIGVRTTTAMCTLVGSIAEAAESTARAVPGVTGATVTMVRRTGWTEDDMSDDGRLLLRIRRERSRAEVPVRPREWERRRPVREEG